MMKWSLHEGSLFSSLNCFRRTVPQKSGKVLTNIKSHGKLKLGSWMASFRKCPLDLLAFLQPKWITFVLFLKTSCLWSWDELWICFLFYFTRDIFQLLSFYEDKVLYKCSPLLPCSFGIRCNSAILTSRLLNNAYFPWCKYKKTILAV